MTGTADLVALHEALDPPFNPLHDQVQGPDPATELEDHALQRFDVGIEVNVPPLALPQVPFSAVARVAHCITSPLSLLVHDHVQGPDPATGEDVLPIPQSLVVGFVVA